MAKVRLRRLGSSSDNNNEVSQESIQDESGIGEKGVVILYVFCSERVSLSCLSLRVSAFD